MELTAKGWAARTVCSKDNCSFTADRTPPRHNTSNDVSSNRSALCSPCQPLPASLVAPKQKEQKCDRALSRLRVSRRPPGLPSRVGDAGTTRGDAGSGPRDPAFHAVKLVQELSLKRFCEQRRKRSQAAKGRKPEKDLQKVESTARSGSGNSRGLEKNPDSRLDPPKEGIVPRWSQIGKGMIMAHGKTPAL